MTGKLVPGNIPVMVRAARIAAERLGYTSSCTDEVGQLLQVLASQFPGELIGEIGGGCGVSTAWMASGLAADTRLVSIDNDPDVVEATRSQFGDHASIEILQGDWRSMLDRGPFAMLFVDVSEAKSTFVDDVIDALKIGGLAVLDDLTPYEHWPEEWKGKPDPVRQKWLEHPRLYGVEILVTPLTAAILATRRR